MVAYNQIVIKMGRERLARGKIPSEILEWGQRIFGSHRDAQLKPSVTLIIGWSRWPLYECQSAFIASHPGGCWIDMYKVAKVAGMRRPCVASTSGPTSILTAAVTILYIHKQEGPAHTCCWLITSDSVLSHWRGYILELDYLCLTFTFQAFANTTFHRLTNAFTLLVLSHMTMASDHVIHSIVKRVRQ